MRLAALLAAALLLLAPATAGADAAGEARLAQHVTDRTGTLTAQQLAELEAPLVALEQRKGSQLAVLVIASTGAQSIEEYSLAVAEANKLGRANPDDGLLLLVAKDDRKARIEVGYGLEGAVTDAQASRVIREYLAPHFRQGDYFGGIREAEGVLVKLVDGEPLPPAMTDETNGETHGEGAPPLMLAIFVGLCIGVFAIGTGLKPVGLRRLGAALVAGGIGWLLFKLGLMVAVAAGVAFLFSGSGAGRFGSGRGGWGSFPGGGGGWGGSSGGGGGWSGGGGSFGGGGASGGW
ncbi:MAG: TPM domain-containing protein [Arenimonas sp.]